MSTTVHPHGRGERFTPRQLVDPGTGSSPRAWGTRAADRRRAGKSRFIPTGVGNASSMSRPTSVWAVHPHGRGERVCAIHDDDIGPGSSPRAWGTPADSGCGIIPPRFIPTGVGNAIPAGFIQQNDPVHPHGRGERPRDTMDFYTDYGSSPRAWGTRMHQLQVAAIERFIPTGVGNACRQRDRTHARPVHPHGRGERCLY